MSKTLGLLAGLVGLSLMTLSPAQAQMQSNPYLSERSDKILGALARGWSYHLYQPMLTQLGSVKNTPPASAQEQLACERFYSRVKQKKEMKIVLGLGYYDASEGELFSFDYYGPNGKEVVDFGMNSTIDLALEKLYREILTKGCQGSLQLCGFKEERPGIFTKKLKSPDGKKMKAVIEMKHASLTPEHSANVGALAAQQTAKSDAAAQWFFGSVPSADLLVYNGHSRKGGGPDFHPPVLLKNLHVNYRWYEKNAPGITRLTNALRATSSQPAAILMMSCNSDKLFTGKLKSAAPQTSVLTTNAVPPSGTSPTKGALAGMDAFLRFQCEGGFRQELGSDPDTQQFVVPLSM